MFAAVSDFEVRISIAVIAGVIIETILRLRKSSRDHIHRLEIITDFSRAITSSLETKQVINLLSAAFQNSIDADAFYVGIREGNEMRLELLYDDGEFYEKPAGQAGWFTLGMGAGQSTKPIPARLA